MRVQRKKLDISAVIWQAVNMRQQNRKLVHTLTKAVLITSLFSTIAGSDFANNRDLHAKKEDKDGPSTVRVITEGNELSIIFPVKPDVYRFRRDYAYASDGEVITGERVATTYVNGVVYLLELLKARRPQRALLQYLNKTGRDRSLIGPVNTQQVTVSGNTGTQQERHRRSDLNQEQYYRTEQCFATKDYLVIISATARAGATPEVNNFFSSLKFGDAARFEEKVNDDSSFGESTPTNEVRFTGDIYDAKAVTRQAIVVWQPPLLRQLNAMADDMDQRRREIQVRAILTPTGEIADVKALQVMSPVVTEIAIEMTRHVKFIPAELNGRAVAQSFTFKYNLRLFG